MNAPNRADILIHLSKIAGEILNLPNLMLTEVTTAKDVDGWDSLSHVQIILAVEKFFKIRLKSAEIAQLKNTGSIIDIILNRQRG